MALGKCRECGREVSKSAKVCPKCGVSKPVKGTSWLKIMGVGVLVLVAFRMCSRALSSDKEAAVPSSPDVAAAAITPAEPAVPVKLDKLAAATLLQAYTANEIAADAKYKGKLFRVTGTVAAIKSDITDDPQIWLVSEYNEVIANGLSKSFAGTLKKGDNLSAICTVTGSVLGTPGLDCSGPQGQ